MKLSDEKYPGLPIGISDTREEARERREAMIAEKLDPAYLAWLRKQPCVVPPTRGDKCSFRIEAHHWPKRSKRGEWSDAQACSLCSMHHVEFHAIGQRRFDNRHGISIVAKILEQRGKYLTEIAG